MARRASDTRLSYEQLDSQYNSAFERGAPVDKLDEKRKSTFGSGYFESYNNMSRASSTESLLEDLSMRATSLFHALDPHQRGFIYKEDLFSLNCDLNEDDLLDVFSQLDQDKDGCIDVDDFKAGLKLINKQIHKKNLERRRSRVDSLSGWSPPQECEKPTHHVAIKNRVSLNMGTSDEGMSLFSCEEKICDFYESLSNSNPDWAEQFNVIIEIVLSDTKELAREKQALIARFHREKLRYENNLRHLEEEYEAQIEEICKKETKTEADKIEKDYRLQLQKREEEISRWKERLFDAEEAYRKTSTVTESAAAHHGADRKDEILHLQRENNNFQVQLSAAQTENTMIRSELVTMKQLYNDKLTHMQQENNNLRSYEKDWQNLTKQLQMLREINRKLQDTNDHLRSAIEVSPSSKEIMSRMNSTSNALSFNLESKLIQCDPAYHKPPHELLLVRDKVDGGPNQNSFLEEHGDSGLSTLRDVTELESEVEPMNVFSGLYGPKHTLVGCLRASSHGPELCTDCQTQSVDNTMVSRPNSLPAERDSGRRLLANTAAACPQNCRSDASELSTSSSKCPSGKQRNRGKRRHQHAYDERPYPRGDASDSEYPIERWKSRSDVRRLEVPDKTAHLNPDKIYKIVFAGDPSVGKTTFIMRLCTDSFIPDCMTTIGLDFRNKTIKLDGKVIALQLWDTAGQERYRSMAANYFRKADGVLLLYDCTYQESFIHVRDWVETIRSSAGDEIPIVLVSNKSDLIARFSEENRKVVSRELGADLAKDNNLIFMETSAKSGENILSTMEELARILNKNEDMKIFNMNIDLAKDAKNISPPKTSCCK